MRKLVLVVACLLSYCGVPLQAQDASVPASATGAVTGHVFCGDTSLPARFAIVMLQPEKEHEAPKIDAKNPDFAAFLKSVMQAKGPSALTHLDGSFRIENVAPGTYYAVPQYAGYLSAFAEVSVEQMMLNSDPEARKIVQSHAQKLEIQAGHSVNIDLRIERGAAISGQILYDDGSPAVSTVAHLLRKQKDGAWKPYMPSMVGLNALSGATDDHGHFRLSGLPAGEYAIMSELPVTQVSNGGGSVSMQMHPGDALQIYSGNVYRQKDMKSFTLAAGEEYDSADLTFPVNGLFKISGSVIARIDNHAVNTASLELRDVADKSKLRAATISPDGTFTLENVPAGEYLLHVSGAADYDSTATATIPKGMELFAAVPGVADAMRKHSHDYGEADLPISVHGELSGISIAVPEAPAKPQEQQNATKD